MELWEITQSLYEHFTNRLESNRRETKAGKDFEALTPKQFSYLLAVAELETPTFRDLSKRFTVTPPSVTIAVQKLIDMGFLDKTQNKDDRRSFLISLSRDGKGIIKANEAAHKRLAKELEKWLTAEEISQFEKLTAKIQSGIEEE